jgi:hypothetical protein
MKSKEQVMLEFKVSDILLELMRDEEDLVNKLTNSDLQGYCGAKASDMVKMFKDEVAQCKHEDFEGCLKRKGLL